MRLGVAAILLLGAASCARCGESKPAPGAAQSDRGPMSCAGAGERVEQCDDVQVAFAANDAVTVRLCRVVPIDEPAVPVAPGDEPEAVTRLSILQGGKLVGCGQLSDVTSLGSFCSGPDEDACVARLTGASLSKSVRFLAPKAFASSRLLVFFGDALDSDAPALEIIQVQKGAARSVFLSEPGKTDKPFLFDKLEDLDGDGRPELLGVQAVPDLDPCQPYLPKAIFSLLGEGDAAKYVRNDALMEKWAKANGKPWHGAEPDPRVQICDDETEASADDE